jgi:predicted acyltransferase
MTEFASAPPLPLKRRLLSLDALRGFDMLCIIGGNHVIRELARWHPTPALQTLATQFDHVPWDGLHAYDLIFPLFMYLSGIAIPLSMDGRLDRGDSKPKLLKKILLRAGLLVLLGIIYNGALSDKPLDPRFASVLGQIGIAWAIAASLHLAIRDIRTRTGILLGWLAAIAALQLLVPVPGHGAGILTETGAINTWIDRALLPGRLNGATFDPEGLLCILSAASVTMAGSLTGTFLKRPSAYSWKSIGTLIMIGTGAILGGWLCWSLGYPPVKALWTTTFDLFAIGISTLLFALFFGIIDVARFQSWSFPLRVIGMNSLTIYLGSKLVSFPDMSAFLFGRVAGLAGSAGPLLVLCGVLVLEWLALYFLYRKQWFLRV